jgi:hypothetical protein
MIDIFIICIYYVVTRFYLFKWGYNLFFKGYHSSVVKTWEKFSYIPIYGEFLFFGLILYEFLKLLVEIYWDWAFEEDEG